MPFQKGKLNPKFKDGRAKLKLCPICKEKKIDYRNNNCQSCENKKRFKNKTYEEIYGNEKAAELKKQRSQVQLGIPKSEEHKSNISLSHGGTGIPYENTEYGAEFDNNLREQVRFRDNYKCKICGCSQLENGRQLDVHHIDYNKKNNKLDNLTSLCMRCHRKTNTKREYWLKYFSTKIRREL